MNKESVVDDIVPESVFSQLKFPERAAHPSSHPVLDHLTKLLDSVLNLSQADENHGSLEGAVDLIISCCRQVIQKYFVVHQSQIVRLPKHDVITEARRLIMGNGRKALAISDLIQELNVPRRTLELVFQQHLGVAPYQYSLIERLHTARSLLKEKAGSVLEVSHKCGFENPSRFSEMYFRQFGELPSQTRKSQFL